MKNYVVVAESGADISEDIIKNYPVYIVPMHIAIEGNDYLDGAITISEIVDYYERTKKVPKTAASSPYDYQQVYEKIRSDNSDSIIIHIGYSANLSSSYESGITAAKGFDRVYHVDSKNVSVGQAFVVMSAINLIESNPDITPDELIARIEAFAALTRFSFIPGNLDYLRAGGRVSNAQYLGASIFRIKPLIELVNGDMITTKKYSGTTKSIINQLITEFFTSHDVDKQQVFMVYINTISDTLKADIEKQVHGYGVTNITWFRAGGVITSHSGPGGIGISGTTKP